MKTMSMIPTSQRVASRFLRRKSFERPDSDEELKGMADFFASQVSSLDDATVAYACYVGLAVPGERQKFLDKLLPKLLLSYRARLVGWFEGALVARANAGGGGVGIKKMENGLAQWVADIPSIISQHKSFKLSQYLPDNEYLDPSMLDRVAQRVVQGIQTEAMQALGEMRRVARDIPLTVRREGPLWVIPPEAKSYPYRKELAALGFSWNTHTRRWETTELTPDARHDLTVDDHDPVAERLKNWFLETWLPGNVDRLTRIFTDYARSKQNSYRIIFSVSGQGSSPVHVDFERRITTAWEAVEELRYRYVGRQGREPWLEVMDQFVKLVSTTSTAQLPKIIDRINNLQHSNGLFMEHFPASVRAWYEGFLNAKYHAPRPDDLAKYIPDRDLRYLMIEIARTVRRPYGWAYQPPESYHLMKKELESIGEKINWRERGYPRYKGEKGVQVDRFAPDVQNGLETLKKLHAQREKLLTTEIDDPAQYEKWSADVVDWTKDYETARKSVEQALEKQRQESLDDPSTSVNWDAIHNPKEFLEQFPYAVPGVSRSELAEFLVRNAQNKRG